MPPKVTLMLCNDRSGFIPRSVLMISAIVCARQNHAVLPDWTLPPGSCEFPFRSEAHFSQIAHSILVDGHEFVDNDVFVCEIGMDYTEALDRFPILDFFAFHQLVSQGNEDLAGLLWIPHESAGNRIRLDQLLALAGRERTEHEDLAGLAFFLDGASRTN